MLSLITEKSNKKKKCAMKNSPKIFKVPSLLDIVSAYLANELLYEKQIQPRETGWYKSRWKCTDRVAMPFGCHAMVIGQWRNGKKVGCQFWWHCRLSMVEDDLFDELCGCGYHVYDPHNIIEECDDWVLIKRFIEKNDVRLVRVVPLKKTYDASRNVTLCAGGTEHLQLKSKLFKIGVSWEDGGWSDGFKMPIRWTDCLRVPKECLTEAFFPIGEIPRNF